jgi:hypothetical protein
VRCCRGSGAARTLLSEQNGSLDIVSKFQSSIFALLFLEDSVDSHGRSDGIMRFVVKIVVPRG